MITALALISVALGSVGQLLLKVASANVQTDHGLWALALSFINFKMAVAITCFVSSMLMWVFVLRKLELSVAYPIVSLGYIFVMILSFYFLQEQVYLTKILGTGLIVAGVIVLNIR